MSEPKDTVAAGTISSSGRKYTIKEKIRAMGPAVLITGSFVGPGTVTTATKTGAEFGYSMLWTIVFAIVATIVLQEMAARLGVVTREGLSEAIKRCFGNPLLKYSSMAIVGVAIPLGCIAYMGGDLTGSAAGLSALTGISTRILGPAVGIIILLLVSFGALRTIERLLMGLVATMAVVYLVSMFAVKPDLGEVAKGLIPTIPSGSLFLVVGLIGTTIVPYNLFLHAVSARKHYATPDDLVLSRFDTYTAITIGGIITAAILITAGTVMQGMHVENVAIMSEALRPMLGDFAKVFLSIGLISAGLSSAIITPLGASYVLAGLFGWKYDTSDRRFLAVNVLILVFGIITSATGFNPITIIISAQVFNGIVLPMAVIFLVVITSQRRFMGLHANKKPVIAAGALIAIITLILGASSAIAAMQYLLPS